MGLEDNTNGNAFFSVFNSGNGGGGGAGSVTSASNVGTGVGVFKAKVLQDLQFRTLLEAKGINIALSGGGDEVEIGLATDVVGIGDGTGWYTFYSSVNSALAVATAGQTIKFFANIVETTSVSLNLVDGVNFDLNGFSYTLNVADGTNMFSTPATAVNVEFRNGALFRTNAVRTTANNGLIFRLTAIGNVLTFDNSFVISNDTEALFRSGKATDFYGGIWKGADTFGGGLMEIDGGSKVINAIILMDSDTTITNSSIINNCTILSTSVTNVVLINSIGGIISNCYISGAGGVTLSSDAEISNCTIKTTTDPALNMSRGIANDCSFYSSAPTTYVVGSTSPIDGQYSRMNNCSVRADNGGGSSGVTFNGVRTLISNCTFKSNTGVASTGNVRVGGSVILTNSFVETDWNDASAIGVYSFSGIGTSAPVIANTSVRMRKSGSYCFDGDASSGAFLIQNVGIGSGIVLVNTTNLTNQQVNTSDFYGNILKG